MVIFDNLLWQTRSDVPNADWTGGLARYVVDDAMPLAAKIKQTKHWSPIEDTTGALIDIVDIMSSAEHTTASIITEIQCIEDAQQRSLAAITAAQLSDRAPVADDVTYFLQYEAQKEALRAELSALNTQGD